MKQRKLSEIKKISTWIITSDYHCGDRQGLIGYDGIELDDGGLYEPSKFQNFLYTKFLYFWDHWVPQVTKDRPFGVIINGDIIDGVHHGAVHQISQNIRDQAAIAEKILFDLHKRCDGRLIMTRGTEAHVGLSAQEEERIAKNVGAIPNALHQYAWHAVYKDLGGSIMHVMHHIGGTSSQAYESTAVHKELTESFIEASRWAQRIPDVIVRSHRHRYMETRIATAHGHAIGVVTPGWQGKTPWAWKTNARLTLPQFGGIMVCQGDEDCYVRDYVVSLKGEKLV